MSFTGMTVLGNVSGMHVIEDIRVTVPFRMAAQISAEQMARSKDLYRDIQDKKVFQIQGVIPAGAVFRSTGAVPRAGAPSPGRQVVAEVNVAELRELRAEIARLHVELDLARSKETHLQGLNHGLQTTLVTMSTQLQAIQGLIEELGKRGIRVQPGSGVVAEVRGEDDVPLFIPESFQQEGDQVNIEVSQKVQSTNVSANLQALKKLKSRK